MKTIGLGFLIVLLLRAPLELHFVIHHVYEKQKEGEAITELSASGTPLGRIFTT